MIIYLLFFFTLPVLEIIYILVMYTVGMGIDQNLATKDFVVFAVEL